MGFMKKVIILVGTFTTFSYPWGHLYEWGEGSSVQQTTDGGYIVTGPGAGEGSYDGDLFVLKTDVEGNIEWKRSFDGSQGFCVQQTSDGGYIVVGETWLYANPYRYVDLWLLKFNADGDTLWTKTYGKNMVDRGRWVEQTPDGGYIITGSMDGTGGIGWDPKLWILKTDANGDTAWTKIYDPGPGNGWVGYCVKPINDGYIVATSKGLMRTDSMGDSLWMNSYAANCICKTSDGGYILSASYYNDVWLIRTDSLGDTLWTSTYGDEDLEFCNCVSSTSDGGYIAVGEKSTQGYYEVDVWLLRLDSNGDTLWTKEYWGDRPEVGESVQQTADGGYVISGYSSDMILLIKTDSVGNVGVKEEATQGSFINWQVITPVGPQITLSYDNTPGGFHASVYNASGQRMDELHTTGASGTITWGEGQTPGVYFIRELSDSQGTTRKVVLIQ